MAVHNNSDRIRVRYSITPARIDALKARLAELAPDVQASHRVEALARGLEFRTWASLLAWKKTTTGNERHVDVDAFVDYLASHGMQTPKIVFESIIALTSPRLGGVIPTREQALISMGYDTWEAWGGGNRHYEDQVNAQIKFVRQSIEAEKARRVERESVSTPSI
jgi:hypothetical protein